MVSSRIRFVAFVENWSWHCVYSIKSTSINLIKSKWKVLLIIKQEFKSLLIKNSLKWKIPRLHSLKKVYSTIQKIIKRSFNLYNFDYSSPFHVDCSFWACCYQNILYSLFQKKNAYLYVILLLLKTNLIYFMQLAFSKCEEGKMPDLGY